MQFVYLQVSCGCTQAVKQEKVYTLGQLKLNLKKPYNSYILKIHQKPLFLCGKTEKLTMPVLAFAKQENSLLGQNLLKNKKQLPTEKFGNILAFLKESKREMLSLISAVSFIKSNLLIAFTKAGNGRKRP